MLRRPLAVLVVVASFCGLIGLAGGAGAQEERTLRLTADEEQVDQASVPRLRWTPCPRDNGDDTTTYFECATARVPLDYDKPDGRKITLYLSKRPATNPDRKIGTLFLNPGGPGGSGFDFAYFAADRLFTPQVRAQFDIVGFDPRGVARSNPLLCFRRQAALDRISTPFPFPYTADEEAQWLRSDRRIARKCDRNAGRIIDHMATADVARDIDLLRRAVGDEQTTFAGYSYGSLLGATYANMFPSRVRAVVIDGVIDPISYATGRGDEALTLPIDARLKSEQGAYDSLISFLTLCDAGGRRCAFSAGDPVARFDALAERLKTAPAVLPDGEGGTFTFTYNDLIYYVLGELYSPFGWPDMAAFLAALDAGRFSEAAAVKARLDARQGPPRAYQQTFEGFVGVWCGDGANPTDPAAWSLAAAAADEASPYFGRAWIWGPSICAVWPGFDEDRYAGPFDLRTANPVMVVGTVNDPATRYQDAESTADILARGYLLTVNGSGHTSLGISECATRTVSRYLLTTNVPDRARTCQIDEVPFARPTVAPRSDLDLQHWIAEVNRPLGR
jgi:pimeloyl-ACP methyl ester carboxylesterase